METSKLIGFAILVSGGVLLLSRRAQGLGAPLNLVPLADGTYGYPGAVGVPTAAQQAAQAAAYRQAATAYADQAGYGYVDPTPGAAGVLGKTAITTGSGLGAAALAPGALTLGGALIPIIGGAVAALSYAIGVKGLFRGGEESLQVSPRRDAFLGQFGPSGDASRGLPWEQTGAAKLAAALTEITGEPDGSHYWKTLMGAQDLETFVPATREIKALLGAYGIQIEAY